MNSSSGRTEHRLRGSALQKLRRRFFQANPLCVECQKEGVITLAVELDHIVRCSKAALMITPICRGCADITIPLKPLMTLDTGNAS